MPLYSYHCPKCGYDFDHVNTVELREHIPCLLCDWVATKVLSPISKPVVYEYYSENLGGMVTGPRQKQRLMKARNVSEAA